MRNHLFNFTYISYLVLNFAYSFISSASAQIVPDTTLPVNSLVTPQGNTSIINGGTRAGSNLFHSFKQFSVPTGSSAFFDNALDIRNIISRVTGKSVSNIDGLISARGTANLFLLNPNGIIFGPNASLNIGGSFLGSTASSLNFADGSEFSATAPQSEPLLTVNVPVGLGFTGNPGSINVQGTGHTQFVYGNQVAASIILSGPGESQTGLRLQPGKTLALVGGDVSFEGGVATAPSGRIEIGSVDSGIVELIPIFSGWNLSYGEVNSFKDIRLAKQSLLDSSGALFGDIHIQGRNITFTDGSLALIANFGSLDSGAIRVDTSETLDMTGITPFNTQPFLGIQRINRGILTSTESGKGADVIISAKRVIGRDSELIGLLTFGSGTSGNLTINSAESVEILGTAVNESSGVSSVFGTVTYGSGQAGNVSLSTKRLLIEDGGALESLTFGDGRGGNVTVNASEFLKISGGYAVNVLLAYGTEPIPSFSPSSILSQSISSGDAGNITIKTRQLTIENGGRVAASGLKRGDSGNITINAYDSVDASGSGSVNPSLNPSIITSSISAVDPFLNYLYNINQPPDAFSGNVTINTERLNLKDSAQVTVRNDSTKNAGTLRVNADSVRLDNQAGITASTRDGQGGNISINSGDLLLLRDNSVISATAGGVGDGGNININTRLLPVLKNSTISANADQSIGGQVTINTQGIFLSPESAITATSELGPQFNGIVQINTPDIDPSPVITKPVAQPEPPKVASVCQRGSGVAASEFVITGTGGIPPSPTDLLSSNAGWQDNSVPAQSPQNSQEPEQVTTNEPMQLVEAQGWRQNPDGTITLTAEANTVVPYSSLSTPSCHPQPSLSRVSPSRNVVERDE